MLGGDHYKWRAMLSWGVDEDLIRGDGDDKQKFIAFADALAEGKKTDPAPFLSAFRILDQIRSQVGIRYPADRE